MSAPGDDSALSPPERLAVAYAPRAFRPLWEGFLLLDQRLAAATRAGRDPLMIQLRLAWWRDRFASPASEWPAGEPLLALLKPWDTQRAALRAMVDGWEARIVGEDGGEAMLDLFSQRLMHLLGAALAPDAALANRGHDG